MAKAVKRGTSLLIFLSLLLFLGIADRVLGKLIFKPNTIEEALRNYILAGKGEPFYKSIPYLNYINYPGNKEFEINAAGIRGARDIVIPKPAHVKRILFLGGSTTFGEVADASDAFPALIEAQMNAYLKENGITNQLVECINGGLGSATSAEIMSHFFLKYRYFDPDIVVIHSGINDAFNYIQLPNYTYQPDYHTSRCIMKDIRVPSQGMRLLCNSFIASFVMVHLYYPEQLSSSLTSNEFFKFNSDDCWLENGNERMLEPDFNAFYNNLDAIITYLKANGKPVVLMTEVVNYDRMRADVREILEGNVEQNNHFNSLLSKKHGIPLVDLKPDSFETSMFLESDGLHVNEDGERLKAKYLLPVLSPLMNP